jgi:hypothetical protein
MKGELISLSYHADVSNEFRGQFIEPGRVVTMRVAHVSHRSARDDGAVRVLRCDIQLRMNSLADAVQRTGHQGKVVLT